MHFIGKSEDDQCRCGEGSQDAAHLMRCKEVGDGKGRTIEQAREDLEWCALVFEFLKEN